MGNQSLPETAFGPSVIAFGLCNAPAIFRWLMDMILQGLDKKNVHSLFGRRDDLQQNSSRKPATLA